MIRLTALYCYRLFEQRDLSHSGEKEFSLQIGPVGTTICVVDRLNSEFEYAGACR